MIRLMKRRALRWLAAVGLGVLLATFGVVGASDASAAEAPFDQPSWLAPNPADPDGRWPVSRIDMGYMDSPLAKTRWSHNALSGPFGYAGTDETGNAAPSRDPRLWLAEPFTGAAVGTTDTHLYSRVYARSGSYDAKRGSDPSNGSSPVAKPAIVCREKTTGQYKFVVATATGSVQLYRRGEWSQTVTDLLLDLGAGNPCDRSQKAIYTSPNVSFQTSSVSWAAGTHDVAGIHWMFSGHCQNLSVGGAFACSPGDVLLASTSWFPQSSLRTETPSLKECTDLFGMKFVPSSQVQINGIWYTAEQMGCAEYMDAVNPEGDWATDFSFVCSNPPPASWTSFDWLPLWMEHYTNCLFVPQIGFPVQKVSNAVADSGIGDVSTVMSDIGESLPSGEACGVLVDASGTVLDGLKISTCSWTWAGPMKTVLTAAVWILTIVGSVWLLVRTITGGAVREGGDE